MRRRWRFLGTLVPALLSAVQAEAADLSGEISLVSDYRYRGLSLSDHKPSIQLAANLDLDQGFYAGLWTSTIRENRQIHSEFDFTAGREIALRPNLSLDLSATYFSYPSSRDDNYAEVTAILSRTRGPLTAKAGISVAPAQRAMRDGNGRQKGNLYYFGGADFAFASLPLKIAASLGYERGAFDEAVRGGKCDWSLNAETHVKDLRLAVGYVDSDRSKPALVGSLGLAF